MGDCYIDCQYVHSMYRMGQSETVSHFSLKDNVTGSDTLHDVHTRTVLPMGREGNRSQLCSGVYTPAHLVWECAHPDCGGWCHWQPHTCKLQSHSAGGDAGRAKCCSIFPPLLAFHCPTCDIQGTQNLRHTKTHLQQMSYYARDILFEIYDKW